MEIALETILAGKAKVMVAGGFDDLCEEGSYEFGNMKATSNSETELAMGHDPTEMSRARGQRQQLVLGCVLSCLLPNCRPLI
jgi:3-oxoacyl-(acyl-carrier-protein) synthase